MSVSGLPPGWTQHIGPNGQPYFHNALTNESTFTPPVKHKERPLSKVAIPGTDWLRVKTTAGNVFYSNKATKASKWTVPEEIADAVKKLEQQERGIGPPVINPEQTLEQERISEVERVKSEVQESIKRKAAAETEPPAPAKKAKIEEVSDEDDSEDDEQEDWEKEAAAQLVADVAAEEEKKKAEAARKKEEVKRSKVKVPDRVDLSLEEGKALFKTLLREKDVNPLHPWDKSLPLFVNDPRYVLLPSVTARREAFDDYCRERARELRQQTVHKEKVELDPQQEYENLLAAELKSTRTTWSDFRRDWKKDRRFYGFGRDDREREKVFRQYQKELGAKKKAAAQKAEADFFALLKENPDIVTEGVVWNDIKRRLVKDPRYDAVGSSSLREELFNTFIQAKGSVSLNSGITTAADTKTATSESKQERKERAVREREAKVRADMQRIEENVDKSRQNLNKEEGELDFKSLLTDAIRDPQMSWESALPQLKTDPRFVNSPLHLNQQVRLFHAHINRLRSHQIENLHTLFESHAPSLATEFSSISLSDLLSSAPVTRLGYDEDALESEFNHWQRERTRKARLAFDQMMTENSFVEFWGRFGKIGGGGVDGGVKTDDLEGEDAGEEAGKVDMKELAKGIDVKEMDKVLKHDRRYSMFDHVPEQRERWIRDYIAQLKAPKLSVHVAS